MAERFLALTFGLWTSHTIYTFISDGGIQEEVSQGAGRLAGHLGLGNLIMFYDSNDIQLSTETSASTSEDTAVKYESWGWAVKTIDGHDHTQIREALDEAKKIIDKPFLIIGKTIMAKGAVTEKNEPFERKVSTHGQPLGAAGASFKKTIANLGGNPDNPFSIFPDVLDYYTNIIEEKKLFAERKKAEQQTWEKANPELAKQFHEFFSGKTPEIDYSAIQQKEDVASRAASGTILSFFADHIKNMIVMSADLSNSDKTDGFLKKTQPMAKGDYSGQFVHTGVSELTMAAVANGMALHGGVIPVCGTFFVFSDYMKPAVRLAALMQLPVKYVWSHDAFRVGEDGPTHQPVEQEAQIRLLEKLKNHNGNNSMLVMRPADAHETTVAWQMAMENTETPSALILSRQNIPNIPDNNYQKSCNAKKGAYVVQKDKGEIQLVMVGNGSEVPTMIEGADMLRKEKGLKIQVVSAISEGVFRNQTKAYQAEVLPPDIPRFGLTAGLPVTIEGLTGPNGLATGLDHFGYSAPYKVLDEEFGFTGKAVFEKVCEFLKI
jgi:transketolase